MVGSGLRRRWRDERRGVYEWYGSNRSLLIYECASSGRSCVCGLVGAGLRRGW
ncbi:MAG: hypothetical protein ACK5XN_27910 [Bacteroidota bacterium]